MALQVAAGVITRDDEVLACQRPGGGAHPWKWEFPGGKREVGESLEDCLRRELEEELGIRAEIGPPFWRNRHAYDHHTVELFFFLVHHFEGAIENRAFAALRWVPIGSLSFLDFLDADRPLVELIDRRAVRLVLV